MEKIILDFTGCKFLGEIHTVLKKSFGFPDYYGENLDALWDCLKSYCDYPLTVEVYGVMEFSGIDAVHKEYMDKIINVFKDVSKNTPNIEFVICS